MVLTWTTDNVLVGRAVVIPPSLWPDLAKDNPNGFPGKVVKYTPGGNGSTADRRWQCLANGDKAEDACKATFAQLRIWIVLHEGEDRMDLRPDLRGKGATRGRGGKAQVAALAAQPARHRAAGTAAALGEAAAASAPATRKRAVICQPLLSFPSKMRSKCAVLSPFYA